MPGATRQQRNSGLDLLRLLAAWGVVAIHLIGNGCIVFSADPFKELPVWLIGALVYGSVDCFALLSGYLGWNRPYRLAPLLSLWLQAILYSVGAFAALYGFFYQWVPISLSDFTPVLFRRYWYFSAYVACYFLMPVLNGILRNTPPKRLWLCLGLVLTASMIYSNTAEADPFFLHGGFSSLWIILLYLLGGTLAKYRPLERMNGKRLFGVYLISILVSWLGRYLGECGVIKTALLPDAGVAFMGYTSPVTLLATICLVELFSRLKLPRRVGKAAAFLAPSAFAVYLIHAHPAFLYHFITGKFYHYRLQSQWLVALKVVGLSTGIFLICIVIDLLRRRVWKILRLRQHLQKAEEQIMHWLQQFIPAVPETMSAAVVPQGQRNAGHDLLRILGVWGLFLIILCHDGLLEPLTGMYTQVFWFLRSIALAFAGCLALLSGFHGWRKNTINWYRLARRVLLVVVIGTAMELLHGGKTDVIWTSREWWHYLLPVHFNLWPYWSAWLICFQMAPLLNQVLQQMPLQKLKWTALLLFLGFHVLPLGLDPFYLEKAPGPLFLILCYFYGGVMSRSGIMEKTTQWKNGRLLGIMAVAILCSWLSRPVLSRLSMLLWQEPYSTSWLTSYTSPLLLLASGALVILFGRLQLAPNKKTWKLDLIFMLEVIAFHPGAVGSEWYRVMLAMSPESLPAYGPVLFAAVSLLWSSLLILGPYLLGLLLISMYHKLIEK